MTVRVASLNLASVQRAVLAGGITVIDRLYLRGCLLYRDSHLSVGGIVSVRGTTVCFYRVNYFRKIKNSLIFFFVWSSFNVLRYLTKTNPEIIERYKHIWKLTLALLQFTRCLRINMRHTYIQKAHPLGTAVLSSSSNESTVGREADILLGERSVGLVAPPFIPVADTRLSIIIKTSLLSLSAIFEIDLIPERIFIFCL